MLDELAHAAEDFGGTGFVVLEEVIYRE